MPVWGKGKEKLGRAPVRGNLLNGMILPLVGKLFTNWGLSGAGPAALSHSFPFNGCNFPGFAV